MVVILLARSPVGCSGVALARETLVPETIMTAADVRKRCLEIVGFASWFCVLNGALLEYLPSELAALEWLSTSPSGGIHWNKTRPESLPELSI